MERKIQMDLKPEPRVELKTSLKSDLKSDLDPSKDIELEMTDRPL